MSSKEIKVTFKDIGVKDRLPYSKADLVKVSRLSNNYSLSFYQLDYHAIAMLSQNTTTPDSGQTTQPNVGSEYLIPVGKIVLDSAGFKQLLTEIEQIQKATVDDK